MLLFSRNSIAARLNRSVQARGLGKTVAYGVSLLFRPLNRLRKLFLWNFREWMFDVSWGVDTVGRIEPNAAPELLRHAERYESSPPKSLQKMLSLVDIDPARFTFYDLGCGKGRLLLLAARYRFKRIVGVEFDAELAGIAERNLRSNRSRFTFDHAEVVCADAGDYEFPDEDAVVYMFNPFKYEVMKRVVENICCRRHREIYIFYLNPVLASALFEDRSRFDPLYQEPWIRIYKVVR